MLTVCSFCILHDFCMMTYQRFSEEWLHRISQSRFMKDTPARFYEIRGHYDDIRSLVKYYESK